MASVYKPSHPDPETGERVKGKYWYIEYRDADGRVRNVKGLRGRAATFAMALELERQVARVTSGNPQPPDPQRRRSLREHIEDFRRALAAGHKTAKEVTTTLRRLRAVLEGCGFFGPTEIDASRVARWIRERREAGELSDASSAEHLGAVKAFTAWLAQEQRTTTDPLVEP